jgi:hypothetical protein
LPEKATIGAVEVKGQSSFESKNSAHSLPTKKKAMRRRRAEERLRSKGVDLDEVGGVMNLLSCLSIIV